jgi:hypothetical protein
MVTALGGTTAEARKLVDVGLWEPTSDGYRLMGLDVSVFASPSWPLHA